MKRSFMTFAISATLLATGCLGFASEYRTILDDAGRLSEPVGANDLQIWQRVKSDGAQSREACASAALRMGEAFLGSATELEKIEPLFKFAYQIAPVGTDLRGFAALDMSMLRIRTGQYQAASESLRKLMAQEDLPKGVRNRAWLWLRHAEARLIARNSAQLHGVKRGDKLNPNCAVKGLFAAIRSQDASITFDAVRHATRVTAFGSSIEDLREGAERLGFKARLVRLTPAALRALPKPVVVHVERERFVTVIEADDRGVRYLCEDCGDSGRSGIELSWAQWKYASATVGLVVTKPDTVQDAVYAMAFDERSPFALIASLTQSDWNAVPQVVAQAKTLSGLTSVLTGYQTMNQVSCGGWGNSVRPLPYSNPPLDGDPVNLATGESHHVPSPDLYVYNPFGPSIWFRRENHSLLITANGDPAQNYWNIQDISEGWTHNYNMRVYDGNLPSVPQISPGVLSGVLSSVGTSSLTGTRTWEIWQSGTLVSSSDAPGSWSVSNILGSQCRVTPPSAGVGQNFQVRWKDGSNVYFASFDVLALGEIVAGTERALSSTGTNMPGAGKTWQVLRNGTVVADSAIRAGWMVNTGSNVDELVVKVPFSATVSGGYEVRMQVLVNGNYVGRSASLSVNAARLTPSTSGYKYFVFPNGSRVALNPGSVPTAQNPVVNCALEAGTPFIIRWIYDPAYPAFRYELVEKDGNTWSYVPVERSTGSNFLVYVPKRQTDRNGNWIEFDYYASPDYTDPMPVLSRIRNQAGTSLLTLVRAAGSVPYLTALDDCYSRGVFYSYTMQSGNRVLSEVSQIVNSWATTRPYAYQYEYYVGLPYNLMLKTVRWPSANTTTSGSITYNYNTSPTGGGAVTSQVDANGNRREYVPVDAVTTRVDVKNPAGTVVRSITYRFDSRLNTEWVKLGNDIKSCVTYAYNDPMNPNAPSSITDGNNRVTTFSYGPFGNLNSVTNNRGVTTNFTYNYGAFPMGRLVTSQIGSSGVMTQTYFEPSGNIASVATADGLGSTEVTNFTYDGLGNVTSVSEAGPSGLPITTQYSYTTDGTYSQTAKVGQPVRMWQSALSGTTIDQHMRYDNLGRMVWFQDTDGTIQQTSFNLADQPLVQGHYSANPGSSLIRAKESVYAFTGGPRVTERSLDKWGSPVRWANYSYGAMNELLSVSGTAEAKQYQYDAAYAVSRITDGLGRQTNFSFNTSGRQTSTQMPGGQTESFNLFDNAGNLREKTDTAGRTMALYYNDANGLLTGIKMIASPFLDKLFDYDGQDRLVTASNGEGSQTFQYNSANQVTSSTVSYNGVPSVTLQYTYNADGTRSSIVTPVGTFSYVYDDQRRVVGLTNPAGESFGWGYQNDGLLTSQSLPNGGLTTLEYDAGKRLKRLRNMVGSTTLSDYQSITYDTAGNCQSIAISGSQPGFTGSALYDHNGKNELVQESRVGGPVYANTYAFDAVGNATTFRGTATIYNSKNEIVGSGFAYNACGSPTTYRGATLQYDAEEHLTSFQPVSGPSVSAGYNVFGLRAWKQVGSVRTYFIYDGLVPILEINSLGNVVAVNTVGPNGLVARRVGSTSTFYQFNPMGGTVHRLNSAGGVISNHQWMAFGEEVTASSTGDPWVSFGAQYGYRADPETGLLLLGLRYYDPVIGRFLNRDPIGSAGGLNFYRYALNSPLDLFDPFGMDPCEAYDPISWVQSQAEMGWEQGGFMGRMRQEASMFAAGVLDTIGAEAVANLATMSGDANGAGRHAEAFGYGTACVGLIALESVSWARLGAISGPLKGSKVLDTEFSHWIPDRIVKKYGAKYPWLAKAGITKRSWVNGKVVSEVFHYRTDSYKYLSGNLKYLNGSWRYPKYLHGMLRSPNWAQYSAGTITSNAISQQISAGYAPGPCN